MNGTNDNKMEENQRDIEAEPDKETKGEDRERDRD